MIKINSLSKPVWKQFSNVKLCSLSLNKKELGSIAANVSHKKDDYYMTTLSSKNGEILGTDCFGLYPQEQSMFDFDINTKLNLRRKFRIGELMRLISIIEMFENHINTIKLYSTETAVSFHAKYGFKADIKRFMHRDKVLETIANDTRFNNLAQKAELLIKQVQECKTPAGLRELCKLTSELTDEYLEKIKFLSFAEQKLHPFKEGFDMKLSKENVLQEKDRFNILFEKHGIDYKI